jgi:prophage DNA circulation protein
VSELGELGEVRGIENKVRGIENKVRGIENKVRGIENKVRGIEIAHQVGASARARVEVGN